MASGGNGGKTVGGRGGIDAGVEAGISDSDLTASGSGCDCSAAGMTNQPSGAGWIETTLGAIGLVLFRRKRRAPRLTESRPRSLWY